LHELSWVLASFFARSRLGGMFTSPLAQNPAGKSCL